MEIDQSSIVPQQVSRSGGREARLLVSVRNLREAAIVQRYPVQVIDFKNPTSGPLGRCNARDLYGLDCLDQPGLGFSVACGELADSAVTAAIPAGFQFAKAGPAGITCAREFARRQRDFIDACGPKVKPVAVAYADYREASSLPIDQILEIAIENAMEWFLVDTSTKDGRCLFDWASPEKMAHILSQCRQHRIETVLAGSLRLEHIGQIDDLQPTLVGVRGAVCESTRDSAIDTTKLARLCARLTPAL